VYNTAVGLAMFPASLIGGWLWDHVSPAATFYYGAITASLSAVLFVVFIGTMRRAVQDREAK
jgi:predicted MFS family arabinose efflux permease